MCWLQSPVSFEELKVKRKRLNPGYPQTLQTSPMPINSCHPYPPVKLWQYYWTRQIQVLGRRKWKWLKIPPQGYFPADVAVPQRYVVRAQAVSLLTHLDLERSSKLVWATPWEDWVSCMQSSASPLPHVFLITVFNAYSVAICLQQSRSHFSSALTEEETLFVWGTPWEAGLTFLPPAICAHSFPSCYQWLRTPCRLPFLETRFSAPLQMKDGETAPAQGPFSPSLVSPLVCSPLSSKAQALVAQCEPLTCSSCSYQNRQKFHLGIPDMGLPKCLADKAKQWSRAGSCEAELTPGQSPLPFSGSSPQGSRLPASRSVVPQINKHRDTSKEIWLLSEACWLMISAERLLCRSLFDFCLFYTVFQQDLRRAESQGSPAVLMKWTQISIGTQGRKKKFGWKNNSEAVLFFFTLIIVCGRLLEINFHCSCLYCTWPMQ